jgi:hypothetical protein
LTKNELKQEGISKYSCKEKIAISIGRKPPIEYVEIIPLIDKIAQKTDDNGI